MKFRRDRQPYRSSFASGAEMRSEAVVSLGGRVFVHLSPNQKVQTEEK